MQVMQDTKGATILMCEHLNNSPVLYIKCKMERSDFFCETIKLNHRH